MGGGVRDKQPIVRWGAQATPILYTAHCGRLARFPPEMEAFPHLSIVFMLKPRIDCCFPSQIPLFYVYYGRYGWDVLSFFRNDFQGNFKGTADKCFPY